MFNIPERDRRDSCNGAHHLQTSFVELVGPVLTVKIYGSQYFARSDQRNAEHGSYLQFSHSANLRKSFIAADIVHTQAGALAHNPLHDGAAHLNRLIRSSHAVPSHHGADLVGILE